MKKIQLSHPNKILYAEDKITKLAVAEYYQTIHEWILPYIIKRPLTLVRCPNNYEKCFYQKHIDKQILAGLYSIEIEEKNGSDEYIYISNLTGLMSLAQLGVLEIHPWGSCIKKLEQPDQIIFDLDPGPKVTWKKVAAAAFEIKKQLAQFKLKSFAKTTGGKGLHIVIPIKPKYDWDDIKNFAHILADFMVMQNPSLYVNKMTKSERVGKIYIDFLRNQRGATAIAPYSTRARLHAPVATPINWDELTDNYTDTFYTIKTLPKRLLQLKKDPWEDFFNIKQALRLDKV